MSLFYRCFSKILQVKANCLVSTQVELGQKNERSITQYHTCEIISGISTYFLVINNKILRCCLLPNNFKWYPSLPDNKNSALSVSITSCGVIKCTLQTTSCCQVMLFHQSRLSFAAVIRLIIQGTLIYFSKEINVDFMNFCYIQSITPPTFFSL